MAEEKQIVVSAKKQQMNKLADVLEKNHDSLALIAAKHLTPERLAKIAMACASRDQKLLDCDPVSILKSLVAAAELGLEPSGGVRGEAYLVPYNNRKARRMEAQLIPGYRGLLKLARNTGEISSIQCRLVYEGDYFELSHGSEDVLVHKPLLEGDRGPVKLAYGVARMKDGSIHIEWMLLSELEKIRKSSQTGTKDYGPWYEHRPEMQRKTMARRLCKWLPLSPEKAELLTRAEELDNQDFERVVLVPGAHPQVAGVDGLRANLLPPSDEEPEAEPDNLPEGAEVTE